MKFSIIIPIYNVEKYIRECLESVIHQDFPTDQYEILVIDDCSPDSSAYIVEDIMVKHPAVRLIRHSENKHLGGARNTGIRNAKGDWIFFVDSDDKWMSSTVLKHFDSLIKEYPASVSVVRSISYTSISNDGKNKDLIKADNSFSDNVIIPGKSYVARTEMFYNVWTSCYNINFLRTNDIFFREHIVFEDSDWSTKVILRAPKIALIDFPFYGYRINPQSITNQPSLKSFEDNISSVFALYYLLENEELGEEERKGINSRIKKSLLSFIKISRYYPRQESLRILKRLKHTPLLNHHNYSLKPTEKVQLWALAHCQWGIVTIVRFLIKVKRFINK